MELKANPKLRGKGVVIESKLDKGRGPVATLIVDEFNESTGEVEIYIEKTVVKKVEHPDKEISLKEASSFSEDVQIGK